MPVTNGLFNVTLDFSTNVFTGPARWLQIYVRTNGVGTYTNLTPRVALLPTPYAIYAGNATTLGGQSGTAYVIKTGDTMTGTLNLPANGLAVGGNQLVASGGNIGIGVTAPGHRLMIAPATLDDPVVILGSTIGPKLPSLRLSDNNGSTCVFGLAEEYNDWLTGSSPGDLVLGSTGNLKLGSGGNTALAIAGSGNVGIGTISPQNQLEVLLSTSATILSNDTAAVKGVYSPSGTYGALGYAHLYTPIQIQIGKNPDLAGQEVQTYGVYGSASSGDYAGYFDGDVQIDGNLNAASANLGNTTIGNNYTTSVGELNVEGNNSGFYNSYVALIQNINSVGNTAPALRVVGWGNTVNGALSVSANGTGLIAQFGNNLNFVADIQTNGTIDAVKFNTTSDRNVKEDFAAVDASAILAKVVSMPMQSWSFKMLPGEKHIGPMAQDFHGAFGLNGADDKHIATVDEEGIALVAIQGLNQRVDEKDAQIQRLKQQNDSLAVRLQNLEQMVQSLADKK